MAELHEAFDIFDTDGSGTMDADELEMAVNGLGYSPSAAELQRMLSEADTDNSGEIDFEEFVAAVTSGRAGDFFSGMLGSPGTPVAHTSQAATPPSPSRRAPPAPPPRRATSGRDEDLSWRELEPVEPVRTPRKSGRASPVGGTEVVANPLANQDFARRSSERVATGKPTSPRRGVEDQSARRDTFEVESSAGGTPPAVTPRPRRADAFQANGGGVNPL
eukprot:COSAG04_NODE_12374_length_656_cov_0.707361_1_plen_218_part_11